jgi:hypothetical protein
MSSAGTKPEGKQGRKPAAGTKEVKAVMGAPEAPKQGEVAGHMSPGAYYYCWNDGALQYVPRGWDYFICYRCHAVNLV